MDYRRTKVEALVVRNNHLLMVRHVSEDGKSEWQLPAAELEEGENPEDGVERALVSQTGHEGFVRGFVHRQKPKEGPYKVILTYLAELRPTVDFMGLDPRDRYPAPKSLQVAWRSLRNPELRQAYQHLLSKARL
ncbi:MAG: NUDIX hydrolase [Firmicutes bacterium]|nr:NUDIX hydrolase [Bacillota bacterium]